MKNLCLWKVALSKLIDFAPENEDFAVCYAFKESNGGELFCCSRNLKLRTFGDDGELKWTKDLSNIVLCESNPVNLTYLSLLNTLCIGFESGEIVAISESGGLCDLVGVCEKEILAMEWSPDQEVFVIVTKTFDTILMSCTYDPINEVNLLSEEFGKKQFMTVDWGKKETQFHGSEGKQAAKVKTEVNADPGSVADKSVKISWRGDGALHAIAFNYEGIRRFKVFDREGILQYTSERQQGLESNIAWRPSGNIIATTQHLNNHYNVAFFEKNGLKHGGFPIPVKANTQVQDILWSVDSEILTLQCYNTEENTQELLLFTTSNYHWYHKQSLHFKSNQKINKVWWDNDFDITNNKNLHVFLRSGEHYTYSWIWNIDHSRGNTDADDAVVAVIDGAKLLLTGFRQTVVPPPMASTEVKCDLPISSVHFAPQKSSDICPNSFFIVTTDNKILFYVQKQKFPLEYILQKTILSPAENKFPFQFYNWYWMNSQTIICTCLEHELGGYHLKHYEVGSYEIMKKMSTTLPAAVNRFQSCPSDPSKVYLQMHNGKIMKYYERGLQPHDISFPVPCPKFNIVQVDGTLYFLGLSHKNSLYINDTIIMNSVTSFFVHTHFLMLTTQQHELLCTELNNNFLDAILEYQKHISTENNIYKRKVERGTKLVIVVPNGIRTVFQMPRGNLEAIQPRPLSLKLLGEYLDTLKYYVAFDLMRKQRINLNLIYDHDPFKFLNNVDGFLETVNNNSWLSLFISDLENIDVTKTMYASSYISRKQDQENKKDAGHDVKEKVQTVCDLFISHIKQRKDSDSKVLPVLTAYVKKNTVQDLENALTIIKNLKSQETQGLKLPVGTDEALKYLLYMVDVNHLFNVSLGMYDFDLVLLVANKSQKDPKEFIPMLNTLNEMDENYKRFSINKYLKRFDEAVKSLAMCGSEKYEELKTFVKYHSLYKESLKLFPLNSDIYREITSEFGNYLHLKKQFIEAGIIFERAGSYDKAVECYKDALEWEMAIKLTCKRWPEKKFKELCWEFVNALKDEKRHNEALLIMEQYCDDINKSIFYAIECGQYKTALMLCAEYDRTGIKESHLVPAILDDYKGLIELTESNWSIFGKYKERLHIVRQNKSQQTETYDSSFYNKDCDLYSDIASTVASSRGSSRTYRSSKNRRKHERKIASLKEGSQYEDVALIMALHSLVSSSFGLRTHVKNFNIVLGCINKDDEAVLLQSSLGKLLKGMKESFKEIWTHELVIEATNAAIAAQNVPEGCSVIPQGIATLDPHLTIAPVIQDINWKLDGFQ